MDHFAVVVGAVRLGITVSALEFFSFALFAVENARNVARNVQSSEWKNGKVAEQFAAIDRHRGGFAAHVHKDTTGAARFFVGHHVGQTIGGHRMTCNRQTGFAETGLDGLDGAGIANDIEELRTNAIRHHAHSLVGRESTHGIFERKRVDKDLILADLIAVVSFERFDQLLLHRNSLREKCALQGVSSIACPDS